MFNDLTKIQALDKKAARKISIFIVTIACLAAVPLMLLIWGISLNAVHATVSQELNYYAASKDRPNAPSEERLTFLSEQLNAVEEQYNALKPSFMRLPQGTSSSALEFKEQVFSLKQRLQKEASKKKVAFPAQYGLEEYETRLPNVQDLPQLYLYAAVVEELLETCITASVSSINAITFHDVVRTPFSDNDPEQYTTYSVALQIECSYAEIVAVLRALASSRYQYSIDQCDIKKCERADAPEGLLTVDITASIFGMD